MTAVVAHRGAPGAHPEGSLEAVRAAVDLGVDGVALDVRRTADGVVVVHDAAQLADGRAVAEVDAAELPVYVPLLIDALEVCADRTVTVEIRNTRDDPGYDPEHRVSEGVAALMLSRNPAEVLVTSLNLDALARIRAISTELATSWVCFDLLSPDAAVERCLAGGHTGLHLHVRLVDRRMVERVRAAGLGLHVWGVDDERPVAQLAEWGVDSIVSEVPAVVLHALGRSG